MLECEQQYHQLQPEATRSLDYDHPFQTYLMPMSIFIGFGMAGNGAEDIPLCFKNFTINPSKAERGTSLVTFTCIDTIPNVLAELVSMDIISESMGKQIDPSFFNMTTTEVIKNSI